MTEGFAGYAQKVLEEAAESINQLDEYGNTSYALDDAGVAEEDHIRVLWHLVRGGHVKAAEVVINDLEEHPQDGGYVALLKAMLSKPGKPAESQVLLDWHPYMHEVALKAMLQDAEGVRAAHKSFSVNVKRAMLLLRGLAGEELSEKDAKAVLAGLAKAAPKIETQKPLRYISKGAEQERPLRPFSALSELALLFGTEQAWDELLSKVLPKAAWASVDIGAPYLKTLSLSEFIKVHQKKLEYPVEATLELLHSMPILSESYVEECGRFDKDDEDDEDEEDDEDTEWVKYLRLLGVVKSIENDTFDEEFFLKWLPVSSFVQSVNPVAHRIAETIAREVPADITRRGIEQILKEPNQGFTVVWLVSRMKDETLFERALKDRGASRFAENARVFGDGALTIGLRSFRALRAKLPAEILPFSGLVRPGTDEWTWLCARELLNGMLEAAAEWDGELSTEGHDLIQLGLADIAALDSTNLLWCLRQVPLKEAEAVLRTMATAQASSIGRSLGLAPDTQAVLDVRVLDHMVRDADDYDFERWVSSQEFASFALKTAPHDLTDLLLERAISCGCEAHLIRALGALDEEWGDTFLKQILMQHASQEVDHIKYELSQSTYVERAGRVLKGEVLGPALEATLRQAFGDRFSAFEKAYGTMKAQNWMERIAELAGDGGGGFVHLLEPSYRLGDVESPRGPESWSVLGGQGPGIDPPRYKNNAMVHVLTIDLREASSLQSSYPDARALAVYVPNAESGENYEASRLVPVPEQADPPVGNPLHVLSVPLSDGPLGDVLTTELMKRGSWVGGEPVHIQESSGRGNFLMQLSEDMGINCGDRGSVYFYSASTHMECY